MREEAAAEARRAKNAEYRLVELQAIVNDPNAEEWARDEAQGEIDEINY